MILFRALLALCFAVSGAALTGAAHAETALVPEVVEVPAGPFIAGSDAAEREYAYQLDEAAYGHSRTREWIFGGVTRSIMRTMTRPVLISH